MTEATVLIAGGGTGGHVFPSLAVAEAIKQAAPDLDVEFLGTSRGLESSLVPEAGWRLHTVETPPLARTLSLSTLRLPGALLAAARQARAIIKERHAVAALVFGGYVSVPLALAARWARIPLVVHEQNAVAGLANRMAGAMAHFDLEPDRKTLLVFGGSQGARRINTAVVSSTGSWSAPERLQILHATGRRDAAEVSAAWDAALASGGPAPLVKCVDFIERMELAYAAADAVVCRSGASTLAELTVLGLPSVLVPYPHATADHQTANARSLERAGAAVVVADDQFDAARLVAEAEPLLLDDDRRKTMAAAARAAGRPDAAQRVAALLLEVLGRKPADA